ncbi:MAG TPA: EAL domain-containing protein [Plasticicumulans sp.]|nr:EAL domain-containing protein [Plasticicumulans sp.]
MVASEAGAGWFLEGVSDQGGHWLVRITGTPFIVGRVESCDLYLNDTGVSRQHARLEFDGAGRPLLSDEGSTNGTFVNYQRLEARAPQSLNDGDIVHFAKMAFRLVHREQSKAPAPVVEGIEGGTMFQQVAALPETFTAAAHEKLFFDLLAKGAVSPWFQPIISLRHGKQVVAYELLGRGAQPGLSSSPAELLKIAHATGRTVELSDLFRKTGIRRAQELGLSRVFFNTMPAEMSIPLLRRLLGELRVMAPVLPMVMEVHEQAIADIELMRDVRALLGELNMKLAYDDFGAGQARLVEIMEVPPDVLKFDIGLVRGISSKPQRVQTMVADLVRMAAGMGVRTLAEGIEAQEDSDFCEAAGFDLIQGYLYGRPTPDPLPVTG